MTLYLGTYTAEGGSRGIYRAELDAATGSISDPVLVAECASPSFLALSPDGRFLYAVHEAGGGTVSAYAVTPPGLTALNTVNSHGGAPCHISVTPEGRTVMVANYVSGTFAFFPVGKDGSLAEASRVFQNEGSGPNLQRQEGPHAHAVTPDARGRYAYGCDLGTDEILVFCLEGESAPRRVKTPAGIGPRHFALAENGYAFANGEMGNCVVAYFADAETGDLTELQILPTVPPGWTGGGTAEIALTPDGRTLVVSNRGHDSLAVFAIAGDGTMKPTGIIPAEVKEPRGFAISPDGGWLVVAGQNSDDLATFRIKDGKLRFAAKRGGIGKPVCIVFA